MKTCELTVKKLLINMEILKNGDVEKLVPNLGNEANKQ